MPAPPEPERSIHLAEAIVNFLSQHKPTDVTLLASLSNLGLESKLYGAVLNNATLPGSIAPLPEYVRINNALVSALAALIGLDGLQVKCLVYPTKTGMAACSF